MRRESPACSAAWPGGWRPGFPAASDRDLGVDLRAAEVGLAKRKGLCTDMQSAAPLREPSRGIVGQ